MSSTTRSTRSSVGLPRVLIVENDPDYRALYIDLLTHWNYQPFTVQGEGDELIKNANASAYENRCQIAIVDMRLLDNDDITDFSGLDLVPKLKPTQTIIVSAFGDHNAAVTSLTDKGAFSFVGKEDGPEPLKIKLEKAALKYCACTRQFRVQPKNLCKEILKNLFPHNDQVPVDEVEEIFARLFPDASRVYIDNMDHNLQFILTHVPRPRSMILIAHEPHFQPVVIKLARARKVQKEVHRYQNFIEDRLVGHFSPPLKKWEVLWDLGAMVYPFLGATSVKTFARYYTSASDNDIEVSLQRFFSTTWSNLYATLPKDKKKKEIFEAYCDVWDGEWYYDRLPKLISSHSVNRMPALYQSLQLPDPAAWLYQQIRGGKPLPKTSLGVTHGDLHGDNMLADEHGNLWVIDFERSGFGPILQDFIELEADIITRLAGIDDTDLDALYRLCVWALSPTEINELPVPRLEYHPAMEKAMSTISVLRRLARQCTKETDARLYYFGLLFNALFRAGLLTADEHLYSQQRTLMFGGLIAHRLEYWKKSWPPTEQKFIWKGIEDNV